MEQLYPWGWSEALQTAFDSNAGSELLPARVASLSRGLYLLVGVGDPQWASCSGRFIHELDDPADGPAVGDWVLARYEGGSYLIEGVLPRTSLLERKRAGRDTLSQVIATNVDRVFIVTAPGHDFSPRRIERYLTSIWDGGSEPVVIVNKRDLIDSVDELAEELSQVAYGVPSLFISAHEDATLDELAAFLQPRQTIAFVGSSGVGKSTIINRVLGREQQSTSAVREGDDKGRHTTTRRELLQTSSGALLIDSPGMREMGLWAAEAGLQQAFDEISRVAAKCRFRDCTHGDEPGCAVAQAITSGELAPERLESYRQLQKEIAFVEARADERSGWDTKKRWKEIHKGARQTRQFNRSHGLKE